MTVDVHWWALSHNKSVMQLNPDPLLKENRGPIRMWLLTEYTGYSLDERHSLVGLT